MTCLSDLLLGETFTQTLGKQEHPIVYSWNGQKGVQVRGWGDGAGDPSSVNYLYTLLFPCFLPLDKNKLAQTS
jgi:hypothetical protein